MASKIRVASNDDQLSEFLFGSVRPWWDRRPWLRRVFLIPLRSVDKSYGRWSKARVSPRRFRKIQERLDREYPPDKFSPSNLIGRDREFNLLLDSFRLHVLRHPSLTKYFGREELPKAVCLAGDSGTGKTFLTMVSLREMLLEGYRSGVLVTPVILKGSDVYSEFYGKSTRQLGRFLDYASSVPSVVYIDEFQSFGRKVRGETGAEIEDTRLQDELNRWLDKIVSGKTRTLVVVATNTYEKIREDIRRRLTKVSLNDGVTREMLLAVVEDSIKREAWIGLKAEALHDLMEREVPMSHRASLQPSHIQEIFRAVRKSKEAPLREKFRDNRNLSVSIERPKISVKIDDFVIAARNIKLYSEQEKSQEVTDAVYVSKPKVNREDVGGLHDVKNKILNHIALAFNPSMAELSELRPEDKVVVIATSNKEQLIDQATRDRFEPNIYYVHPPQNDAEWNEVVGIHLRKFGTYLHPEVDAGKITKMFRRQRILSPRGAAETVSEAHRMWASEVAAAREVTQAKGQETSLQAITLKYQDDLDRLDQLLAIYKNEGSTLTPDQVNQDNYKIRLFHFQRAISSLESLEDKEHREIAEALILSQAIPGVTYGLYTSDRGSGGILTIQCTVGPIHPGERHVSVTGQASSMRMGRNFVPGDFVIQRASNALEQDSAECWLKARANLSRFHVAFQIRSILEGAPGQGVSGPSAGYAMLNALVSELSGIPIPQSRVMTGTIGLKMDIGPVGGLGGRGREAGKLVGILKAEKIKVTDLLVPESNFKNASDEMKMIQDEGIIVHPIANAPDGWPILFSTNAEDLAKKIRASLIERESVVDMGPSSSRLVGSSGT